MNQTWFVWNIEIWFVLTLNILVEKFALEIRVSVFTPVCGFHKTNQKKDNDCKANRALPKNVGVWYKVNSDVVSCLFVLILGL